MPRKRPDEGEPDPSQAQNRRKLEQDQLVSELVKDPADVPELIVLFGFLGEGTQQGQWRLYLGPSMSLYVEFHEGAVVYHRQLPPEQSYMGMGGTQLWLKREARLRFVNLETERAEADWLRGSITSRAWARPQGFRYGWNLGGLAAGKDLCNNTIIPQSARWCQSLLGSCDSLGICLQVDLPIDTEY